jgi:ABC-type transporter Mla subunit MlaD
MPPINPDTRNRRGCFIIAGAVAIALLLVFLFASWTGGDSQQANEATAQGGPAGG